MDSLFLTKHKNNWEVGGSLGAFLYGLTKLMRPEVVLEFGTFKGFSAMCFARALEEDVAQGKLPSSSRVLTYDTKNYEKRPGFSNNDFIQFEIGDSTNKNFVRNLYLDNKKKCRIVFFDTKHSYERVKCEFESINKVVSEDTLIVFHDTDTGYERHTAFKLFQNIYDGEYDTANYRFQAICLPTRWCDDYCLERNKKDKYGRRFSDGLGIIRKEIIRG